MDQKQRLDTNSGLLAHSMRRLLRAALVAGCAALAGTFASSAAAQSLGMEDLFPPVGTQSLTLEAITPSGSWVTLEPGPGTQYLEKDTLLLTPWGSSTDEGRLLVFSAEGELTFDIQIGGELPRATVAGVWDPNSDSLGGDPDVDFGWHGPLADVDMSDGDDFGWYGPLPDVDISEHWSPYGGTHGLGFDFEYVGRFLDAEEMPEFGPIDEYFPGMPTDVPGMSESFGPLSLFDLLDLESPQ